MIIFEKFLKSSTVTRFSNKDKNVSFSWFFSSWVLSLFHDSLVCKLMTHHWLLTHQARGWLCETSLFSLRREKKRKNVILQPKSWLSRRTRTRIQKWTSQPIRISGLCSKSSFFVKKSVGQKSGLSLGPNKTD